MKKFDNAELELIAFEAEDVISTSGEPETIPSISLEPAQCNNHNAAFPTLFGWYCPICKKFVKKC